jgi:hypothetical protein
MVAEADRLNNNDLAVLGAPSPVFFVSVASKAVTKWSLQVLQVKGLQAGDSG